MSVEVEQLYRSYGKAVFAFLINLTRSEADAGDLLHEVFFKLVGSPKILGGVQNVRSYLFRMAHNIYLNSQRRRASYNEALSAYAAESESVFSSDQNHNHHFIAIVSAGLETLPPDQRAVLHLKLWESMTFLEIADVLAIRPATAASRYRYAIVKLEEWCRSKQEIIR